MISYLNIAVGLVTVLLGYLIWQHNMLEMLAGYEPDKVADKEGLARWVGANLLLMGLAGIFSGVIGLFFAQAARVAMWSFFAVIVLLCVRIVLGNKRFES